MNEAKIQISFIRDDPGIVIRGDTAEEVEELLRSSLPIYKRFRDAVDKGKEKRTIEKAPGGNIPHCETCGTEMKYKEGAGKPNKFNPSGKWSGFFCPNSTKEDKNNHKPVWL